MDIVQKNALTLAQPDVVRFPDLPNEVDNYHELCPLEPIHKPASTMLGYQTSTYKATSIKSGTRYCLRRVHGEYLYNLMNYLILCKRYGTGNEISIYYVFRFQTC